MKSITGFFSTTLASTHIIILYLCTTGHQFNVKKVKSSHIIILDIFTIGHQFDNKKRVYKSFFPLSMLQNWPMLY